ncbi:MAG: GLUG motif-containing protein, partial [Candidatus ainarchaeum sp.]|nr:GLUG motif-containing protein [Candidatus ainarchaeum sp.]
MDYKIIILAMLLLAGNVFAVDISTCDELQNMNLNLSGNYVLTQDVDCDIAPYNIGSGFDPIGDNTTNFTGSLNGAGHKITGLFINRPETNYVGLFGFTSLNAIIQNVSLKNVNITGSSYVGSLIGNSASSSVKNVFVEAQSIIGKDYVGGLIGKYYFSAASRDLNDSSVKLEILTSTGNAGGLIGGTQNGGNTTKLLINRVSVNVSDKIYSTGSYVGGLIGNFISLNSTIVDSNSDINSIIVEDYDGEYVGGFVGNMTGDIYNSFALVNNIDLNKSSGDAHVGGLAGSVGFVENSWVDVNINASLGTRTGYYVGGLVGESTKGISNSYSIGDYILATKSSGSNVGGLAGKTFGPITDCNSNFNEIKGNSYVGGLIGKMYVADSTNNLKNNYAEINTLQGFDNYVGGLIGQIYFYGSYQIDFNDSDVNINVIQGDGYVGGLVGGMFNLTSNINYGVLFNNLNVVILDKIYSTSSYVGGIIGKVYSVGSTINNCHIEDINYIFADGYSEYVGGLVGQTDGNIYNSSFIGQIDLAKSSGDAHVGGLAGSVGFVENSWVDVNINASLGTRTGYYVGGL